MPQMDQAGRRAYEQALHHFEELLTEQGDSTELQYQTAITALKVGSLNHLLGDLEASEDALRRAVELSKTMAESEEYAKISRRMEANACRLLGYLIKDMPNRSSEAAEIFIKAAKLYRTAPDAELSIGDRIMVANILLNQSVVVPFEQRRSLLHEALALQTGAMRQSLGADNELQDILNAQIARTIAQPNEATVASNNSGQSKPPRIFIPKGLVLKPPATPDSEQTVAEKNPQTDSGHDQLPKTSTPPDRNTISKNGVRSASQFLRFNPIRKQMTTDVVTKKSRLEPDASTKTFFGLDKLHKDSPNLPKNKNRAWLALEIGLTIKQSKIPASIQDLIGQAVAPMAKLPLPDDFKTLHAEATAKIHGKNPSSSAPSSID